MAYEKKEQLYEGKAKKVYASNDPEVVIVSYKDDATAFNGLKKGTITGKGAINNRMTNNLMRRLEAKGVPTHYVEELNDRETAVKKVSIVPLEVIVRNISAGSFAKRYGVEEGIVFDQPTIEFSYKNDDLGDPLINDYHALAMELATPEEIETIKKYAFKVNEVLKKILLDANIRLIDFKLEFGRLADGTITNWSEVGGADAPIVVVGREAGSGTRSAFEEILEIEDQCAYANELDSTGAVMARVASTPGAIGYISLDVLDDTVKALKLEGADPTEENIKAGSYFLSRPFVMATKGEISEQNDLVKALFDYIYSAEGSEIVKSVGLITVEQ